VSCAQGKRQARVARRAMAPGEQWAERALRRAATLREVVGHGEERLFFRNFRILLLQKFFSQNLLSKKFYVCRQNFFKKKFNKRFYKFSFSEIFFILLTLS
jgi:hypothetical protein